MRGGGTGLLLGLRAGHMEESLSSSLSLWFLFYRTGSGGWLPPRPRRGRMWRQRCWEHPLLTDPGAWLELKPGALAEGTQGSSRPFLCPFWRIFFFKRCFETGSHCVCGPGWPGTCGTPSASASWVLGLKARDSMPGVVPGNGHDAGPTPQWRWNPGLPCSTQMLHL